MAVKLLVLGSDGTLIPHTPEEYARLWHGVDREAAMTLGSPLYDGTAPGCDEYTMGPGPCPS